ncbi:MAG: serine/threonine protein kinase [Acidobacteriota bacterium]|nr:serine/threonine protein kinase [Acidobacteriota bacterium]
MSGLERFIGEVLDGKYRLERLLGQGGMGAVYLAIHLGTDRPVALKLIAPELMRNEEFIERFKREARAAGRLRHPNVVDVTDFGFAQVGRESVAYLVMEYLDGCSLGDVLAEEARLPLDWVIDILEQTCSAVDEAHQQGILHRDLKPDNIWLEPTRLGGYRVKVLDFGIAKLAEAGDSTHGVADENNRSTARATTQATASASARPNLDEVQASIGQAATLLMPQASNPSRPESSSETETKILPSGPSSEEQQTRMLTPSGALDAQSEPSATVATSQAASEEEAIQTRILERTTASPKRDTLGTASMADVTRVGTILGTPLYMSPEQCMGKRLDVRSDIYSLGVIAYQMLTGQTPFGGDTTRVLRQHMEEPPPPIREKNGKVKRKVARVVMSALSKNPDERPASAAAFATSLRGNSEGIGALLRRAFALYSEYFPKFLRISFLAHIPIIVLAFLLFGFDILKSQHLFSRPLEITLSICLTLLSIVVNFVSNAVITGLTVVIVTQLHVAPMRPVSLRESFAVLKRRWRLFLRTSIRVSLTIILGLILLIIPGFIMMVRYALYAPVILMEGLGKGAALKRSNELSRRSRRTVIALLLINFLLPIIINGIFTLISVAAIIVGARSNPQLALRISNFFQSISHFTPVFNIVVVPLISITTGLLYLKMRQIGGETFKETLEQFENIEAPRTKWQQRMRTRLTMHTHR